jgi:hypothetical protein
MLTRRQLLKTGAAAGTALSLPWGIRRAYPFAQSPTNIRKFVVNVPGLGPTGANQIGQYIPLATKMTQSFAGLMTDVYNLGVAQFGEKMHPDLPSATLFWGYYDLATGDQKYLAGVIVAKRGVRPPGRRPIIIRWAKVPGLFGTTTMPSGPRPGSIT